MKTAKLIFIITCFIQSIFAQEPLTIQLKTGVFSTQPSEFAFTPAARPQTSFTSEIVDGSYFRLAQFSQILGEAQVADLQVLGIKTFDYLAERTYLFKIPVSIDVSVLQEFGLISCLPLRPEWKVDPLLYEAMLIDWAHERQWLKIHLVLMPSLSAEKVLSDYKKLNFLRNTELKGSDIYSEIKETDLILLAEQPSLLLVERISAPAVPDDIGGNAGGHLNLVTTAPNIGLTGKGVKVLVRDDGAVGPHIDFQGRLANQTATNSGIHGDAVSGVLAGAGNLNQDNIGVAPGVTVFTMPYEPSFEDLTLPMQISNRIVITNTSYSDGCNTGYTKAASTVDKQLFENPTFMHVFSAGNSNYIDCGYGTGANFGNITGGHKQSKNSICVGNVNNTGLFVSSSSRGPATDGRIKPEIMAPGFQTLATSENNIYKSFTGTSASAPYVSGCLALLYEDFRATHNDADPPAALIKAAVLNTATDLGTFGPDFTYGFGMINVDRAQQLLAFGRYATGSVANGQLKVHNFQIPTGTAQLRAMLYWADPAASVLAAKALVNNLDLTAVAPIGTTYYPYLLNAEPNVTTLSQAAITGPDNLNNVEQIVIDYPQSGNFTFKISGAAVPKGPQTYWLVFELVKNEVRMCYPNGGEHFEPGQTIGLHWDGPKGATSFTLKYSNNAGATWTNIGTYSGLAKSATWIIPTNLNSSQLLFSVTSGLLYDQSDQSSVVAPIIQGLQAWQINSSQTKLQWKRNPNAVQYEIFKLGVKYMDSVAFTSDTSVVINSINTPSVPLWVSVRPVFAGGKYGKRAIAIQPSPLQCSLSITTSNNLCNQNGTPYLATDDTYSFEINVSSVGSCGSKWSTSTLSNIQTPYGTPLKLGPFYLSGGAKVIEVFDVDNPTIRGNITVNPPSPCVEIAPPPPVIPNCASSLFTNSGFETGGLAAWLYDFGVTAVNPGYAGSLNSANICGIGRQLGQRIPVVGGNEYQLEFYAKTNASVAATLEISMRYFDITWNTVNYIISPNKTVGQEWNKFTLKALAPSTATSVDVTVRTLTYGCFQLDNFCFNKVLPSVQLPQPDLELTIKSDKANPGLYQYATLTINATNKGTAVVDNVEISALVFSSPTILQNLAYVTNTATKGIYNHWSGKWTVGSLGPGENARLEVTVFTLKSAAINCFAQITQASVLDLDSSPGNNTSGIPNEDDEALFTLNGQVFRLENTHQLPLQSAPEVGLIYPNPANQQISLFLPNMSDTPMHIELFNQLGQSVKSLDFTRLDSDFLQISVDSFLNGLYFMTISMDGQRQLTRKFLVQHED